MIIDVKNYIFVQCEVSDVNRLVGELCSALKKHEVDSTNNALMNEIMKLTKEVYAAEGVGLGGAFEEYNNDVPHKGLFARLFGSRQ